MCFQMYQNSLYNSTFIFAWYFKRFLNTGIKIWPVKLNILIRDKYRWKVWIDVYCVLLCLLLSAHLSNRGLHNVSVSIKILML